VEYGRRERVFDCRVAVDAMSGWLCLSSTVMHIEAPKRWAVLMFSAVLLLTSCKATVGVAVKPEDYPLLKQTAHPEVVHWRKVSGPHGDMFLGRPKGDKSAIVGLYRHFPQPGDDPLISEPDAGVRLTEGRLGVFRIVWHQVSGTTTPRCSRTAIFDFKTWDVTVPGGDGQLQITERMLVWVHGDDEAQVEDLVDYLGGLDLFRERTEPLAGI
jgi:hypothetical protein